MTKRSVTPLFAVVVGISAPAAAGNDTTVKPRTLPSGAPACGNAQTKGPRRPCVADTASPAQRQPVAALPERPRLHRTGAPPCGNVLDKVMGNERDVAYQYCIAGIDPDAAMHGFKLVEKAMVLLGLRAATSEQVRVDEAEPRCMKNGSPACGNVAKRSVSRGD